MLDEPIKRLIPAAAELNAIADRLHVAACKVDEVHLGARYSFANYAESVAAGLKEWAAALHDLDPPER